jgi:hypothetical protein
MGGRSSQARGYVKEVRTDTNTINVSGIRHKHGANTILLRHGQPNREKKFTGPKLGLNGGFFAIASVIEKSLNKNTQNSFKIPTQSPVKIQ